MGFTVLEKMFKKDEAYRKQREIFYIQKMEAQYKGINRDKGGWTSFTNCDFKKISISVELSFRSAKQYLSTLWEPDLGSLMQDKFVSEYINFTTIASIFICVGSF